MIKHKIKQHWANIWNIITTNKLREIKDSIEFWNQIPNNSIKQKALTRMRIEHEHILNKTNIPSSNIHEKGRNTTSQTHLK